MCWAGSRQTAAAGGEPAVKRAAQAIEIWIGQGVETAMNRYNADPDNGVH